MPVSDEALIFGYAYLNNPKCTLQFGGEGALLRISEQSRAALDELLSAGFVEVAPATTQIVGREYYRGKIPIGPLLGDREINPFALPESHLGWPTFVKIEE